MIHFRLPVWMLQRLQKPLCAAKYHDNEIALFTSNLYRASFQNSPVHVVIYKLTLGKCLLIPLISMNGYKATEEISGIKNTFSYNYTIRYKSKTYENWNRSSTSFSP